VSTFVCGGCKWQNMKYSQQLYYKQNEVFNHLQRIGKVELPDLNQFWVLKNSFTETKWNFLSNSRWLTEAEIGSTESEEQKCTWFSHTENVGFWTSTNVT
jgi:23S rRNA (uracil1939-C5)-methyltransferase